MKEHNKENTKIIYVFLSQGFGLRMLISRIIPELEAGTHSVDVLGMCFFDGNQAALDTSNPLGARLEILAKANDIILMEADVSDLKINEPKYPDMNEVQTSERRKPTECPVIAYKSGKQSVCYPDVYSAVAPARPEHFISL